jgi:hypothetical protein
MAVAVADGHAVGIEVLEDGLRVLAARGEVVAKLGQGERPVLSSERHGRSRTP